MIVTAPSGLAGEIRSLKLRELKKLADPSLARGGRNIDLMLSMFESITDPGPYKWPVGGTPVWDQVLLGDRFALLIDIRVATFGPDYGFPARCTDPTGLCGHGYDWDFDLRDLPRKPYPTKTLDQIRERRNRFTTIGPRGETVTYRLLFGADEKTIEAYRRKNNGQWSISEALVQKIVSVDGVKESQIGEWVDDLDAQDGISLAQLMDLADGGVETNIEIVCPKCSWQEWISLPFGKTFFAPSKRATEATTMKQEAKEVAPGTEIGGADEIRNGKDPEPEPAPSASLSGTPARKTG